MKTLFRLGATLFVCTPILANANVWDDLKTMPATQYDVGRIYTDIAAIELNKVLEGEELKETRYRVKKVTTVDTKGKLGLKFILEARGKYINPSDCPKFASNLQQRFSSNGMIQEIWPSLPSKQLELIAQNYIVETELVNKDNDAVITTCSAL